MPKSNALLCSMQVNVREALLVFVKYDCGISLGHYPKNVVVVVQDVKSKVSHDRNADDVSNSVS